LRQSWLAESTVENLAALRGVKEARGKDVGWIRDIESELLEEAKRLNPKEYVLRVS